MTVQSIKPQWIVIGLLLLLVLPIILLASGFTPLQAFAGDLLAGALVAMVALIALWRPLSKDFPGISASIGYWFTLSQFLLALTMLLNALTRLRLSDIGDIQAIHLAAGGFCAFVFAIVLANIVLLIRFRTPVGLALLAVPILALVTAPFIAVPIAIGLLGGLAVIRLMPMISPTPSVQMKQMLVAAWVFVIGAGCLCVGVVMMDMEHHVRGNLMSAPLSALLATVVVMQFKPIWQSHRALRAAKPAASPST